MGNFKGRGIVLKQINIGESDKIVTLLLKDIGKVSVFARSARQQKSKFLAGTEVFTYADFLITSSRKYLNFSEIDIIESFYSIRTNYENLCYGYYFLEVTDKVVLEDMPCDDILLLLLKSLQALSKNNINIKLIQSIFNFKFLHYNGYIPQMDKCSSCYNSLSEKFFFGHDGVICQKCKDKYNKSIYISSDTIFTINHILESDISVLFKFKVNDKINKELNDASKIFLKYHLDLNFKSLNMID